MAWSRPFFGGAFFGGGFFGGTGTTAGWDVLAKSWPCRTDDDVRQAREDFGTIPQGARAAIRSMARRYATAPEWDETKLKAELLRRLHGEWSSHYFDALMDALDDERQSVNKLALQMRHFRIAPCPCGADPGLGYDAGSWRVACECGEEGEADDKPMAAVRSWNASRR